MTTTEAREAVLPYEDAIAAYDPVLGLEVHVELNTATKMFCGCADGVRRRAEHAGMPGVPRASRRAARRQRGRRSSRRSGSGWRSTATIAPWCRFARKNYFYPDMPKNFQTSQYDEPIAFNGWLDVELEDGSVYRVEIERAHMEEDTGKTLHVGGATGRIHGADHSLVDYNRAGIPLIEIVTKPMTGVGDRAPEIARAYVGALRELLRALDVSDVRMEQGSLRCDANVSLRPRLDDEQESVPLGTRTETKNVNSLRSVERAVRYEITRQAAILRGGGRIVQETRHWHEDTGVTTSGREKSDAMDYRYFPEPDLVPVAPSSEMVAALRQTLPEPPGERRKRLQTAWGYTDLEMRDVANAGAVEIVEETDRRGCDAAGGAQVVERRGGPAGQCRRRGRRRVRGVGRPHPGARRRAGRAGDLRAAQRLDGPPGAGWRTGRRGFADRRRRCARPGDRRRTTRRWRRPSTRRSRRTPTSRRRCAAARSRPPAP